MDILKDGPVFAVGETYRNRHFSYTVLGIEGDTLRVLVEDGTERTLSAARQRGIMANMQADVRSVPELEQSTAARRVSRSSQAAGVGGKLRRGAGAGERPVWVVRGGSGGEREDFALDHGLAIIGFPLLPDLTRVLSRDQLLELFNRAHYTEGHNETTVSSWVGQIWRFFDHIQRNDLVVLPRIGKALVAVGTVAGEYEYRDDFPPELRHVRAVNWLCKNFPRASFDKDMQKSMSVQSTVYQIRSVDADRRIRSLLDRQSAILRL